MRITIHLAASWKEVERDTNVQFLFDLSWLCTCPDFQWLCLTLPATTWRLQVQAASRGLQQARDERNMLLQRQDTGQVPQHWNLHREEVLAHPVFLQLKRELHRLLRGKTHGVFRARISTMTICLQHRPACRSGAS
uniref:Uncharacterized protein n=1 Tax=Thermogemmatispora argillosa TaxID=2045280 RepID=A0A455SV63_9CHLR|nr:hypothetical protein KTA_04660 [Thermogemmatispora argillosa]